MRFLLEGGPVETIHGDFARVATVDGAIAYGIRCKTARMEDQLFSVSEAGGESKPLATIERRTKTCKYGDLAVDGNTIFATDWEGRRLLAIDLPEGKVKVLATGHPFASRLFVHAEHVDFATSNGLRRVSRAGGAARKLGRVGESMFDLVAFDGSDYWIFDGGRFEREYIWRLRGDGGEPERVYTFRDDDPLGSGAMGMSADEQCFYYSQMSSDEGYAVLYAQKKPERRDSSPR
jgi:sugar lactone lactonase YvrE